MGAHLKSMFFVSAELVVSGLIHEFIEFGSIADRNFDDPIFHGVFADQFGVVFELFVYFEYRAGYG